MHRPEANDSCRLFVIAPDGTIGVAFYERGVEGLLRVVFAISTDMGREFYVAKASSVPFPVPPCDALAILVTTLHLLLTRISSTLPGVMPVTWFVLQTTLREGQT